MCGTQLKFAQLTKFYDHGFVFSDEVPNEQLNIPNLSIDSTARQTVRNLEFCVFICFATFISITFINGIQNFEAKNSTSQIFCFLLLVYKEKYLKLPSKISTLKQLVILFSDSLQFLKSLFPLSAVQHTELIDISFLLFSSEWMLIFMFCNKMFCAR